MFCGVNTLGCVLLAKSCNSLLQAYHLASILLSPTDTESRKKIWFGCSAVLAQVIHTQHCGPQSYLGVGCISWLAHQLCDLDPIYSGGAKIPPPLNLYKSENVWEVIHWTGKLHRLEQACSLLSGSTYRTSREQVCTMHRPNLPESSWFLILWAFWCFWPVFGWYYGFVWRLFIVKKKCLNFHGLPELKKMGQNSPIGLSCSKIGHSCEAFAYLFCQNISTPLLSAVPEVWISPKLPVTPEFKRISGRIFLQSQTGM